MRKPDLNGPAGRAWRIPNAREGAQVGGWFLLAPGSHPFWPWKVLTGVHLRGEIDGQPAHIQFPGATHEVLLLALDPDHAPPDVDVNRFAHWLTPPDLVHQLILPNDDALVELLELCAHAVVEGILVPDSDYRRAWASSLDQSAEHARLGGHPQT